MATFYIVQAGRTEWSDAGRFESAVGMPLSEAGAAAVREVVEELRSRSIVAVYSSDEMADCQSAQIAADVLQVKHYCRNELHDLDYGLWQGLLVEEVRHRYAKAYRQWRDAPVDSRPPGGESFAEAQERISGAIRKIARKHKGRSVLLVLKPIMVALLNCRLTGQALASVWQQVELPSAWTSYEIDAKPEAGEP